MRRLTLAVSAVFLATAVALAVSLFGLGDASMAERGAREGTVPEQDRKESAGMAQYHSEDRDHAGASQDARSDARTSKSVYYRFYERWLAREGNAPQVREIRSEGSAPGARPPAEALSVMEAPAPYSQVVDNAAPQRFLARGWKKSSKATRHYGDNYSYVRPARDAASAWFKLEIPATDYYTVYARWPAARDNNAAARFGVRTPSGIRWTNANQQRDGGMWVRLGAYEMEAGNGYAVKVSGHSKAEGRVVADAVMVVRGTQMAPQGKDAAGEAATGEATRDGAMAGDGQATGREVIQRARTHIGTPYRHSPPLPCEAYRSEDCSCLTKEVFSKWLSLPDDPVLQWTVGKTVAKPDLVPGDLVFFKEAGESNPITHVAIYSGAGNIIHASTYWGHVVERPMEHVSGYYGAKRLT